MMEINLNRLSLTSADFRISEEGWYVFSITYNASENKNQSMVLLDGISLANLMLDKSETEKTFLKQFLNAGIHSIQISTLCGAVVDSLRVTPGAAPAPFMPKTRLSNPNASAGAKRLMEYLGSVYGKKVLTGQHTKDIPMEELSLVEKMAGKKPAVCGFELLGYSPNIDFENSDEDTLEEVRNNQDTIKKALEWAEKDKGIVTYCWHWFSPMGGRNKAFYTEHTDFDCSKAVTPGTPEYEKTVSDIDFISEKLQIFAQKDIPILWRPLHEAEGGWFWWGAKGPEACKKLWRLMYDRMVHVHGLNNLIWVWNSIDPAWYPGDDVVDIISADIYALKGNHGTFKCDFDSASALSENTMIALSECGTNPDIELSVKSGAPWLWFMTWCGEFMSDNLTNGTEYYKKTFSSEYAVTLDQLPDLYC